MRGQLAMRSGNTDKAKEYLQRALAIKPYFDAADEAEAALKEIEGKGR